MGPPPVRSRDTGRWGLAGLPGHLASVVKEDNVLWLRFLFLYALAQAAGDGPQVPEAAEGIERVLREVESVPDGVTSAFDLAKWALQQAAKNLASSAPSGSPSGAASPPKGRKVFFGWEHPRDPEMYMSKDTRPQGGWVSWWAFTEWHSFAQLYSLYMTHFDQGKLGHQHPKPSSFGTSSWFLHESLHCLFLTESERRAFGPGPKAGKDRLSQTPKWARWAPGLSFRTQQAWTHWVQEYSRPQEVDLRQAMLARFTEEERMRLHVQQDHTPFKKGCPTCLAAQARQRSHWLTGCSHVHSASFDLAGPFVAGRSYDPAASGRDRGGNYRYFLACAFAVPILPPSVSPQVEGPASDPPDAPIPAAPPELELLSDEGLAIGEEAVDDGAGIGPWLDKVTFRIRGKRPEPADDPVEEPPLPPPVDPPPVKTRMLFMAVPLRTKHAKEVLPAVQSLINRLEAHGLPVHRYHADRAQELKAKALVSWCRERGIHATWTPGESPAGNVAELAVQNIKANIRKLLFVSKLSVDFWPLAALHASRRNWISLFEQLGIVQPSLLPFGLVLHARKRTRTGYEAQWQPRTVQGVYLGHAPDTPGGHLVLVQEHDGSSKVLLTNSVYPLASSTASAPKPRYRIKGKTHPTLVKCLLPAHVVAHALPGCGSRFSPGGEWGILRCSDSVEGQGVEEVQGVEDKVEVLKDESCPEDSHTGQGLCDFWSSEAEFAEPEQLVGDQVWERPLLGKGIGELRGMSSLGFLKSCTEEGRYDFESCLQVLRECVPGFPPPRRATVAGDKAYAVLGLYSQGGFKGITRFAQGNPDLTKYLNGFVRTHHPQGSWSTLYLARNTSMPVHRDTRNLKGTSTWIVGLGDFMGGGLWVDSGTSEGSVLKRLPDGRVASGHVLPIKERPQLFDSSAWHEAESWVGQDRWVIVAYVPQGYSAAIGGCFQCLKDLGFPVEGLPTDQHEVCQRKVESDSISKFNACPVSLAEGIAVHPNHQYPEDGVVESWYVEFPHELWNDHEAGVFLHQASLDFSLQTAQELQCAIEQGHGSEVAGLLRVARLEVSWWEVVLELSQPAMETCVGARLLNINVPLVSHGVEPDELFLQTRAIPLDQVRKELPLWEPPAREEVDNLENVMQAVERVTTRDIEQWTSQGYKILQIPGKAVTSRKSGTGRRKFRAVACGNFLESATGSSTAADTLYASGVDSSTVRLVISHAASRSDWAGVVADVKCAFLHAPRRQENAGEIWVIRPPYILVELGVLKASDRWRIQKAIYGLRSSPRDWQVHRDSVLRDMLIDWEGRTFRLVQAQSDESLWLIRQQGGGPIAGTMVIYVDDLIIFAIRALCSAVLDAIKKVWQLSTPEWIEGAVPVKFCGLEILRFSSGYRVNQQSYIAELLSKHAVKDEAAVPLVRWTEPEALEEPSPEEVKSAQALTGALLWLSTRSRPDIAYSVARMAQFSTRSPQLVLSIGNQVLRYLKGIKCCVI